MIVHKIWTTHATGRFHFGGTIFKYRERHWEGYFLLGIIPLFVKNVKNLYTHY